MKIHQVSLCGLTEAFPGPVSVDFEALGPGLIALVGPNGAGKSTLIGSIFAALFRQLPGQKRSLYDFCTHPKPEIDLTFSVNGQQYRSLLKIDPKSRQMESYLFNGEGAPLTNGKKDVFQELIRKRIGTIAFFESAIFSNQKRTGNFLGLDRSERKELFIRELLGLDRLRLIATAAKEKTEEPAKTTIGLEGQSKSLRELVDGRVEDPAEVESQLADVSSRLEMAEAEKRVVELRMLELQSADTHRRPLLAEIETLKQRLRKTDAEVAETNRQVAKDESLLAGKKDLTGLAERATALTARIEELHRQIREAQGLETSNRETERTVQALDGELRNNMAELERLRVEREELAIVPCRGEGPYASCPKIRRAVEAGRRSQHWKERSRHSHSKSRSNAVRSFRLSPHPLISPGHSKAASGTAGKLLRSGSVMRNCEPSRRGGTNGSRLWNAWYRAERKLPRSWGERNPHSPHLLISTARCKLPDEKLKTLIGRSFPAAMSEMV